MCVVRQFSSIVGFIEGIQSVRQSWDAPKMQDNAEVWFRGVNDSSYKLKPGTYRGSNIDERYLLARFQLRAFAFLDHEPSTEWDGIS